MVLQVERIRFGYRGRSGGAVVLDDAYIDLDAGDSVALFGQNGAGKTTLLRVIAGFLRPSSGRVLLDGQDVTALAPHRRVARGISYLPQGPSLLLGLSVRDNIAAATNDLRRTGACLVDRAIDVFGLASLAARKAAQLSGGERRRVELARLLAQRPQVALLDEPFAGLDPLAAQKLAAELNKLRESGVALLVADHSVDYALTSCRRAYILDRGRVVASGTAEAMLADSRSQRLYFGLQRYGNHREGMGAGSDVESKTHEVSR